MKIGFDAAYREYRKNFYEQRGWPLDGPIDVASALDIIKIACQNGLEQYMRLHPYGSILAISNCSSRTVAIQRCHKFYEDSDQFWSSKIDVHTCDEMGWGPGGGLELPSIEECQKYVAVVAVLDANTDAPECYCFSMWVAEELRMPFTAVVTDQDE